MATAKKVVSTMAETMMMATGDNDDYGDGDDDACMLMVKKCHFSSARDARGFAEYENCVDLSGPTDPSGTTFSVLLPITTPIASRHPTVFAIKKQHSINYSYLSDDSECPQTSNT